MNRLSTSMKVIRNISRSANRIFVSGLLVSLSMQNVQANVAAHVHGEAELTVLFKEDVLEIELISPAADILGFERKAKNQKENAHIKSVVKTLNGNDSLFSLPVDKCKLTSFKSDLANLLSKVETQSNQADHSHKETHHSHHDDHKSHDDHKGDDDHDDHKGAHREIKISQEFYCRYSESIDEMNVTIFKTFPAIEKIKVIWEKGESYGVKVLTPKSPTIVLK